MLVPVVVVMMVSRFMLFRLRVRTYDDLASVPDLFCGQPRATVLPGVVASRGFRVGTARAAAVAVSMVTHPGGVRSTRIFPVGNAWNQGLFGGCEVKL